MQDEYVFKIIVIGQAATGKTSYIKRYVHELFSDQYKATIGVDFALKTLQYDSNTTIRLQLWDIAGQDRFHTMSRAYYKDAVGAILVLDSNRPRLDQVLLYKATLDAQVSLSDGSPIPCLLLANKCDLLENSSNEFLSEERRKMMKFVKENGFIDVLFTSAKLNINIDQSARILIKHILMRQRNLYYLNDNLPDKYNQNYESSIRLNQRALHMSDRKQKSCCI